VKLLPIPAGEDGLPKSFRVPGVAAVTRRPSFKEGDHKNIFATTVADACAATTLPRPSARHDLARAGDGAGGH
jgi:hypothetical protein